MERNSPRTGSRAKCGARGRASDPCRLRGLESLTLRPMGLTAPPDEIWVVIGFEANGQKLERRFEWQVIEPPPVATGADVHDPTAQFGEAAQVLGFDAETEAVRRARKSIFDQPAMEREKQVADILVRPKHQNRSATCKR